MDKLRWCRQQKKGIRLIAPGKNVQGAYIIKAEEALDALKTSRTKSWKIIGAYYAIYNLPIRCLWALASSARFTHAP